MSKENTDQTGGVKEKQTISETDIPRGNLYSKKAVKIAITRLTNKYKKFFFQNFLCCLLIGTTII